MSNSNIVNSPYYDLILWNEFICMKRACRLQQGEILYLTTNVAQK